MLTLALLAALPSAFAQEHDQHGHEHELDRVLVRATPLATTAEDLTRPVEVLSGERLDEAKAATLGETVSRLPGVQSSYFGRVSAGRWLPGRGIAFGVWAFF